MKEYVLSKTLPKARKGYSFFLALCWTIGLVLGIWSFFSFGKFSPVYLRDLLSKPASTLSLLIIIEFPLLIVNFTAWPAYPWSMLIVCFGKSFLTGFLLSGSYILFGKGVWLARYLVQFSSVFSGLLLYFYCLRVMKGSFSNHISAFLFAIVSGSIISFIDFTFISPFWMIVAEISI